MIRIDTKFSGRTIVCGLNDDNIKPFMRSLLKNIWLERNIPDSMKTVGSGNKLTLDMLPSNINLNEIADKAVDKKILMLERIGAISLWLNLWITKTEGTNPDIKVDIDKYEYEKNGDNISSPINNAIKEITNL